MATIIVGIGDLAVSHIEGDVIKTFALGSCVGVVMIDPTNTITGMLHCVLPDSKTSPARARDTPGYFADSGLTALVAAMEARGGRRSRRWIVKLAGGAKVLKQSPSEMLDIGKRNLLAVRKNLWKLGLGAISEDVGKDYSRTVSVTVGHPAVLVENKAIGDRTI